MQKLESSTTPMENSFYMNVGEESTDPVYDVGEGLPDTDNDEPADESETEAVWSDMDLEGSSQ